jgi:L-lactate utilization protein LutB
MDGTLASICAAIVGSMEARYALVQVGLRCTEHSCLCPRSVRISNLVVVSRETALMVSNRFWCSGSGRDAAYLI